MLTCNVMSTYADEGAAAREKELKEAREMERYPSQGADRAPNIPFKPGPRPSLLHRASGRCLRSHRLGMSPMDEVAKDPAEQAASVPGLPAGPPPGEHPEAAGLRAADPVEAGQPPWPSRPLRPRP